MLVIEIEVVVCEVLGMISVFVECLIGVYYFDIIFDFGSLV